MKTKLQDDRGMEKERSVGEKYFLKSERLTEVTVFNIFIKKNVFSDNRQ